jgi:hypothetical protein
MGSSKIRKRMLTLSYNSGRRREENNMQEIELILKWFEKLVTLFGPVLSVVLVLGIIFLYFKYFHSHLKNGGVVVFGKIKNNETKDETRAREKDESVGVHSLEVTIPGYCLQRLEFCKGEFKRIEEHLLRSDKKFDERGAVINETHEDVAVIRATMGIPRKN